MLSRALSLVERERGKESERKAKREKEIDLSDFKPLFDHLLPLYYFAPIAVQ